MSQSCRLRTGRAFHIKGILGGSQPGLHISIITRYKRVYEATGLVLHTGAYWWEYKVIQLLWKTVWHLLKKLSIPLSYNPAVPPLVELKE